MLTPTRPHDHAVDVPDRTLVDVLLTTARTVPDALAVVDDDVRLTWSELVAQASEVAGGLTGLGVQPGDVVLVQLPNWWETVVVTWGVWLAGGVVLPVVPIYRTHELGFIVDQVEPAAVVASAEHRGRRHADELRELLRGSGRSTPVVAVRAGSADPLPLTALTSAGAREASSARPDDVALVLYTSGTTSAPKGALHTHRTLLAESASMRTLCRLTSDDRVFMPSPLSHVTGLSYAVVLPADLGASAVLLDRWDPEAAVATIEREACTLTVSATPFLRGLAETYAARGASSLRTFVCGGADIPSELVRRAHAVMGTAVVRTYGSTELPTVAMADPFGDLDAAADGEGVAIGANEMTTRVDDEGLEELLVRGPELFVGYVDATLNDTAFTTDGWFRTGDAATISADGVLRISGRIKDVINRGGEKYSAAEVEWALLEHPDVTEVAVVGYPDDVLGERACAFVVPAPGGQVTLEALRDHLVGAGYAVQKAPERLELVDLLPRTPSGKIQKFRLREGLRLRPLRDEVESPT